MPLLYNTIVWLWIVSWLLISWYNNYTCKIIAYQSDSLTKTSENSTFSTPPPDSALGFSMEY